MDDISEKRRSAASPRHAMREAADNIIPHPAARRNTAGEKIKKSRRGETTKHRRSVAAASPQRHRSVTAVKGARHRQF